jgi:hypothetical protein
MKQMFAALCLAALAAPAIAQPLMPTNQSTYRDAWAVYNTKYKVTEEALKCAGFVNLEPKQTTGPNQKPMVEPHPAVRHANDVDAPVRGRGPALCHYVGQPQHTAWYERNFNIKAQKRSN